MPTYQYACTECDHGFEAVQSFSDDALTECPQCDGRLRKVFNSVGIVFKGSGFYRTDSREKAPTPAGAKGDGGKTETKSTSDSSSAATKADTSSSSSTSSAAASTAGSAA
ncbi:MAG TPA: FmdB family zinc ribbon protein [Actinomycetes bacterium]